MIDAISRLANQAQPLLKAIEGDKDGPYFYRDSADRVLGVLQAAIAIADRQEEFTGSTLGDAGQRGRKSLRCNAVFIVHGHDQALLQQVARFIEMIKMKPVVLFEEAAKGQTIIEKLESNSDVPFALVLLTPDDLGRAANQKGDLLPRARQNVILELGYFLGKLGRDKVAVLHDENIELPSDYRGVEYIKVDADGAWKLKLGKELKAAGLSVDVNAAM